jgi:hypothetical protein
LAIKKVVFVKKTALVTSIFGEVGASFFTGTCSPDGCSEAPMEGFTTPSLILSFYKIVLVMIMLKFGEIKKTKQLPA